MYPRQRRQTRLLKCSNCGSLNQDERRRCGLCGSGAHFPREHVPQSRIARKTNMPAHGRARAIRVLTIGTAFLVVGALLIFLPPDPSLAILGFFVMAPGAIILLVITGVFSGTPYRSRILNRAEQERKRREQKEVLRLTPNSDSGKCPLQFHDMRVGEEACMFLILLPLSLKQFVSIGIP